MHKYFVVYHLYVSHPLHLDSSLRTKGSRSRRLTARCARRWKAKNPAGPLTYRDPAAAHALTEALIGEVIAADTVLIGLPLYNFDPPSTFKAWFDRIVSEQTMGKLSDKTFAVVTARDGGYGPGTPRDGWDHREPWLRHALSTLGVDDPAFVSTELTLARESPAMIPLVLGDAEDKSMADALAAVDALLEV
jgi:FMN-dependent NADH-azoreductase